MNDEAPVAGDSLRARLLALLGRKFLIAAFITIAATVLAVLKIIDQATLLTTWGSVMGLFGLANVSQKAVTKANTSTTKEAP